MAESESRRIRGIEKRIQIQKQREYMRCFFLPGLCHIAVHKDKVAGAAGHTE